MKTFYRMAILATFVSVFVGVALSQTTPSPNMNMPIPVPGVTPGPAWATDINASLSIVDSHNHTPGSGVQIPSGGLSILTPLTFNGTDAINLRSTQYNAQASPLSSSILGAVYVSGLELYYNDEAGNQVQLTKGGSVNGASGTITGLPSSPVGAGVAYSSIAQNFSFISASTVPAAMNQGPTTIGNQTAGAYGVTLYPNAGIGANYNLIFPAGLPAATDYVTLDNAGNLSYNTSGKTGSGAVVLGTSPTIASPTVSGTVSGAITFSGVITFLTGILVSGGVATDTLLVSNTGGNVPHACAIRTSSTTGTSLTKTCNAGEIVTGGGCNDNAGCDPKGNYPSASNSWTCITNVSCVINAYAICCGY